MTFNEGDVVSQKIGGPLMTVEQIRHDDVIATVWFVGGIVHRDSFHPNHLNKWELANG